MKRLAMLLCLFCCLVAGCGRLTPEEEREIASRLHCGVSVRTDGTLVLTFRDNANLSKIQDLRVSGLELVKVKGVDLTPLEGVSLRTLSFSPGDVAKGLGVVRGMSSLKTINRLPATDFWRQYDSGTLGKE